MSKSRMICLVVMMAVLFSGTAMSDQRRFKEQERRTEQVRKKPPQGYIQDKRHRHNRYYPPSGYVRKKLPTEHRSILYRSKRYYFSGGVWYDLRGSDYVVIRPPIGIRVRVLPRYYTRIWIGDIPYYYAGGIYYRWFPDERVYVVSEPPPREQVMEDPAVPEPLFIYPKKGQSEEQQAADRYECHRWAVQQTGFDPISPGGNVPEQQYAVKRSDYYRAMKACLEGRDYTVK